MPKIHSLFEIKFVGRDWAGDERGYPHEVVIESIMIDHYAEQFERALIKARDQIKLCAEVGHEGKHGCGAMREDGTRQCAFWLASIEGAMRTPERPRLVRITIPVT